VILPELGEKLGAYAQNKMAERRLEIHVNTKLRTVSKCGVHYVGHDDVQSSLPSDMRCEVDTAEVPRSRTTIGGTGD
jgi:NADH dehydrogenase FAD-containing subunit